MILICRAYPNGNVEHFVGDFKSKKRITKK